METVWQTECIEKSFFFFIEHQVVTFNIFLKIGEKNMKKITSTRTSSFGDVSFDSDVRSAGPLISAAETILS